MESTTLREQYIVQPKSVKKEYGVHVTSHTVCYSTNHFILRTKKKYGVYIINRTVYHLINVLIMDAEKEYGVRNTKSTVHRPTKKEYGVHVTNRTVYHLSNDLTTRTNCTVHPSKQRHQVLLEA